MAVGSGIGASLGIGDEGPAYGTFAPPTRWPEFESEKLVWKPNRTVGKGLAAGRLVSSAVQRVTTTSSVEGEVVTPVYSKGMGLWLGLIFGTMGLTPEVQGVSAAYLQNHVLGSNAGQSASIQVGRPTMDGVVHPYSHSGVVVTKAVFEAKLDEPLRLTVTLDGQKVAEDAPLVEAVFEADNPAFFWNEGAFQMGPVGSEIPVEGVRTFTLTIDRSQKVDNFYLNATGLKGRPVENDFVKVSGQIETDFLAKESFVDLFVSDEPQSIVVPFHGGLIGGAYSAGLTLIVPHCRFDSDSATVTGPDILQPKMAFTALDDAAHAPVSALYMSTDTTL